MEMRDAADVLICAVPDNAVVVAQEARIVALETAPVPPAVQLALDALDARVATLEAQVVALQNENATQQVAIDVLLSENTAQQLTIDDHEARIAALEAGGASVPPELARLTDCFWAEPGALPTDPPIACRGRGEVEFRIDPADPWPPQ